MSYKGISQAMIDRLCSEYGKTLPVCIKPLTILTDRCSDRMTNRSRLLDNPNILIIDRFADYGMEGDDNRNLAEDGSLRRDIIINEEPLISDCQGCSIDTGLALKYKVASAYFPNWNFLSPGPFHMKARYFGFEPLLSSPSPGTLIGNEEYRNWCFYMYVENEGPPYFTSSLLTGRHAYLLGRKCPPYYTTPYDRYCPTGVGDYRWEVGVGRILPALDSHNFIIPASDFWSSSPSVCGFWHQQVDEYDNFIDCTTVEPLGNYRLIRCRSTGGCDGTCANPPLPPNALATINSMDVGEIRTMVEFPSGNIKWYDRYIIKRTWPDNGNRLVKYVVWFSSTWPNAARPGDYLYTDIPGGVVPPGAFWVPGTWVMYDALLPGYFLGRHGLYGNVMMYFNISDPRTNPPDPHDDINIPNNCWVIRIEYMSLSAVWNQFNYVKGLGGSDPTVESPVGLYNLASVRSCGSPYNDWHNCPAGVCSSRCDAMPATLEVEESD